MQYGPGDEYGQDGHEEHPESRGRFAGGRWKSNVLLGCLVLGTVLAVVLRGTANPARPAAKTPPPPRVHITTAGHRLLGVSAGWELFARGPDDLLRIELAQGKIIQTYVPELESASPDVSFVIGAHEAVIRPFDNVPGYLVPDNGQARQLTGLLAGGGELVPGPAGSQGAWVSSGSPTSPELSLVSLAGHRSGPSIDFQPSGAQLPDTAASDGRGDVLAVNGNFDVYDIGPGWVRAVPGTVVAVGAGTWLVDVCGAQYRHCRDEVVDTASGARRWTLPRSAAVGPPYSFLWPPTGVISPSGSTAAILATGRYGQLNAQLIDLRTGAVRDLNLGLGSPGGDTPLGGGANDQSMAWSPDGRWLFVAASGGRLVVVDARTGRIVSLGVRLPPVYQVAIRP